MSISDYDVYYMVPDDLKHYLPIAQALEALLHPFAEIVLHDLRTEKVVALVNNFSKRKIGEDSQVDTSRVFPDFFPPYCKTNWDGKKLKSTTATLRNAQGEAIGLLCINLDISVLDSFQGMIENFLTRVELPSALFEDDWKEKISTFVHNWLKTHQRSLGREEKHALVHALWKEGAFRAKHAAAYVAQVLQLSRATVYKYLKEIQDEAPPI